MAFPDEGRFTADANLARVPSTQTLSSSLSSTDFRQLRAFAAVAAALSFTRGAEQLGVTNSALSRTVRLLEERIGVRLIERTTRSVALTEAGDNLFRRVRPAVAELDRAVEQAKRYRERSANTIRIHGFRSAADLFIRPVLRSFSDAYPEIVIDITLGDETVEGISPGYDISIRSGELSRSDIVSLKLHADLRQIAVASPDYVARYGVPNTPYDLAVHRCIGWRLAPLDTPHKWEFCEEGSKFDIAVDGPVVASSRELAVQAAIDGLGIAYALREVVAPHIVGGRLIPLLEPWSVSLPDFYLCYPAQRTMALGLRVFIEAIRAGASERTV
jgi:DNA-binding transcriptional LysR family regulator